MDAFLVALAWGLGLMLLSAPVLAWVAFLRSREIRSLRERVETLETRIRSVARAQRDAGSEPAELALPANLGRSAVSPRDPEPGDRAPAASPPPSQTAQPPTAPTTGEPLVAASEAREAPSREAPSREAPSREAPSREAPSREAPSREPLVPLETRSGPLPASPSTAPTESEREPIDWEQWLGVRGAAVVGGIALALAGLFFFQYAIAHGWFGPGLRVLVGSVLGLACVVSKAPLHRRGYGVLSDVLAGAGIVMLYGAAWASYRLYGFVPMYAAFAWMAAVTALAGILAARYDSQIIALFGLVGGFATPLLLSTGENRPISLFGYVLLLDLGLLALGRRQGWPLLGVLGLAGTALMQGLWIAARMEPDQAWLGLGVLAVFAVLFSASGRGLEGERKSWVAAQIGGVGVPFLFALYYALAVDLGERLWPLGLLLGLLVCCAAYLARERSRPELPLGAAAASVAVALAWTLRRTSEASPQPDSVLWSLVAVGAGLTALLAAFTFLPRRGDAAPGAALQRAWFERRAAAPAVSALGFLAVLFVAASSGRVDLALAPLATGGALLAALVLVSDRGGMMRWLPALTAVGAGCVLAAYAAERSDVGWSGPVTPLVFAAVVLAFAAALLALAAVRAQTPLGARLAAAAAVLVVPVLVSLVPWAEPAPARFPLIVFALAAAGAAGAARAGSGLAYGATALAAVFALTRWNLELTAVNTLGAAIRPALAWQAAALCALAWMPLLSRAAFPPRRWVLVAAALSTVTWATPINWLEIDAVFERDTVWIQLTALAAIAAAGAGLGALATARARAADGGDVASAAPLLGHATTLYAAVAAAFASFALARAIDVQWVPVGAAFAGVLWLVLARVRAHEKLAAAAHLALFGAGTLLVVLAVIPNHFARSESTIFNAISFAYFVSAACLVAPLALPFGRAGDAASSLVPRKATHALAALAALVVFAGLNLLVVNAFGDTPRLRFEWERVQDRDLVQSLVWGGWALVLLIVGTARKIGGLRWMSLAFQVATIAKVFLYDLGELTGLYRVGSMMGLAVCLLVVSLLYQRFVFRRPAEAGS